MSKAVEQLNQLTQQNAAGAEESASAAEEMSSLRLKKCAAWLPAFLN